jgi:hypothetical protein
MPLIPKSGNRLPFQFGRASALRSTGETLDQLLEQLRAERAKNAQAAFNIAR